MAIKLEFLNFIIPIPIIKSKYLGGWEQCLKDHERLIGGRVWYDEYLFRDGAMNPSDIGSLVEEWQSFGFNTHEGNENPTKWLDVCVVDAYVGAPTLPCDWIEINDFTASYKATKPSKAIGREHF